MCKQTVKFEDGSTVEWVDRETLRYSDGMRSALIWVDFEPRWFLTRRIVKGTDLNEWEACPPEENKDISDEAREKILSRVADYYKSLGIKFSVEQGRT